MRTPIRIGDVIVGVAAALLFHAVILTTLVYGLYVLLERLPRRAQVGVAAIVVSISTVAFVYGFGTTLG